MEYKLVWKGNKGRISLFVQAYLALINPLL